MDSNQAVPFPVYSVDPVDRFDHGVDGFAGELVTENVEADI